jgi:rare lipoprotein A
VLSRYRYAQLPWIVLLMCGLFVFGSDRAEAEEALASWYGPGFDGLTTASGETYGRRRLSTAHPSLPMGTDLIVSYGGKSVPVTVNDRGPITGNRELDLSQGAAKQLGLIEPGVDYVDVTCANGGIYPNCVPGSPAPQEGIAVQEVPAYTSVQEATAPQYETSPQYEPALSTGAPLTTKAFLSTKPPRKTGPSCGTVLAVASTWRSNRARPIRDRRSVRNLGRRSENAERHNRPQPRLRWSGALLLIGTEHRDSGEYRLRLIQQGVQSAP